MAIRTDQYTNTLSVVDTVNANASLSLVPQGAGAVNIPGTGQNFLLQSQAFTTASWIKQTNVTATDNTTVAPDGTTTAATISWGSASNGTGIYGQRTGLSWTGLTNTKSIYVRADVAGGTVTMQDPGLTLGTATLTLSTAWQRITLTESAQLTIAGIWLQKTASSPSTIYIWGGQLEIGSVANTYVPTTTTAVYGTPTLSFSGVASLGLQSDGSLYETSAGTGNVRFYTNNIAQEQMRVSHTASAVNYVQVTGAATLAGGPVVSAEGSDFNIPLRLRSKGNSAVELGNPAGWAGFAVTTTNNPNRVVFNAPGTGFIPTFTTSGVDTNAGMAFISKGTGAIDLAAGSSGVNISNGGTVTAITRTNSGSGYTSFPAIAISAPTTAGGVQATATVTLVIAADPTTVQSGGTGYAVNDVLTMVGGTPLSTGGTYRVTAVSGGVVTSVIAVNYANYTAIPSNPVTTTGGTGTGCTLNVTYAVQANGFTITNAGSGYVEQPTVTFSGGGGSGAAAYAKVGSATTIRPSLNGVTNFVGTGGGTALQIYDAGGTSGASGSYWNIGTNYSSSGAVLYSTHEANFSSGGTNAVRIYTNTVAQEQLRVTHTASAVNYVQVTGAATGGAVNLSAQGSDTNIQFNINSKNAFGIQFGTGGGTQFLVSNTAAAANYLRATGGATGFGPVLSAQGSDTNIPAVVQPKGTGALQAQQTDSTATGGNARGANAVDWQTVRTGVATQVASGSTSFIGSGRGNTSSSQDSFVGGGYQNLSSSSQSVVAGGANNQATAPQTFVGSGLTNYATRDYSGVVVGSNNSALGYYNFIGGGATNSGTANTAVTTQSSTMNGTTAVTLGASNGSIKVGQLVTGTFLTFPTYVAAVSGTSLTLSQNASGSGTSTLSFFTPHGVVVGGGNNQATGAYSFIGGGGDAGTAANRNVASGDWSIVAGGQTNNSSGLYSVISGGSQNTSSGLGSVVVGGNSNTSSANYSFVAGLANFATGNLSAVLSGANGNSRSLIGAMTIPASNNPTNGVAGSSQAIIMVLGRTTTDATPTVLCSNIAAAGSSNQVIMPNNSAYYFFGTIVAGVTGGGDSKGWRVEGLIKRGASAAATTLVGSTVTSSYADAGASTWTIALSADTTNGGLAVTFTGQASTTIRCVAKIETTEMTY